MSELILSNFALHIALAPDEQAQVLALLSGRYCQINDQAVRH